MGKKNKMPIWVWLAYSSITTRKSALILIWACLIFSIYTIPWASLFTEHGWLQTVFLIEDWSWFAMMVPITVWYWISLKWIDNHQGWADTAHNKS